MNPTRMIWHLFRFHLLNLSLLLWGVLLLYCAFMVGLQWSMSDEVVIAGDSTFGSQVYFFILAAQMSWGMNFRKSAQSGNPWGVNTSDFLWTRAVDRGAIYWAKLMVFALFCSLLWVNASAAQLFHREPLKIELWKSASDNAFKRRALDTPGLGAKVVESKKAGRNETLVFERGRVALMGLFGVKVVLLSLLILWCAVTLRSHRAWLIAAVAIILLAVLMYPLLSLLFRKSDFLRSSGDSREQLVTYARHAPLIWSAALAFGALVVGYTRRRYVRLS